MLLPPEHPRSKGIRLQIPDRLALTGILFVARTGTAWELLPPELGCGSGMTCWRRLWDWQVAGIWQKIWKKLLDKLGLANKIDWSKASRRHQFGSSSFWGAKTGPNPTDREKNGSKKHVISDGKGIMLAVIHTGANVYNSQQTIALVDAIPTIKDPMAEGDENQMNCMLIVRTMPRLKFESLSELGK